MSTYSSDGGQDFQSRELSDASLGQNVVPLTRAYTDEHLSFAQPPRTLFSRHNTEPLINLNTQSMLHTDRDGGIYMASSLESSMSNFPEVARSSNPGGRASNDSGRSLLISNTPPLIRSSTLDSRIDEDASDYERFEFSPCPSFNRNYGAERIADTIEQVEDYRWESETSDEEVYDIMDRLKERGVFGLSCEIVKLKYS